MATAVKLTPAGGGNPTIDVKGVALEGLEISPRLLKVMDRDFWGVSGTSRIFGGYGKRTITVPVLVYDATLYDTAEKLADYIDTELNTTHKGATGTAEVTSESDHDAFTDCSFEGAQLLEGPKKDFAGTLGGGYWAIVVLQFTQLS
jgi:hypothetical protein